MKRASGFTEVLGNFLYRKMLARPMNHRFETSHVQGSCLSFFYTNLCVCVCVCVYMHVCVVSTCGNVCAHAQSLSRIRLF